MPRPNSRWICDDCAKKKGGKEVLGHLATYHVGRCGVCKENKNVTEPRDFKWAYGAIAGILLALVMLGCVHAPQAKREVELAGFSNVVVKGYAPGAGSVDDDVRAAWTGEKDGKAFEGEYTREWFEGSGRVYFRESDVSMHVQISSGTEAR